MRKKLTVNTLALGNLKHRKKQYAIMIIGIVLAMVFSSSMILYFFSSYEAMDKKYKDNYGKQDVIATVGGMGEEAFSDAKDKKLLTDYGVAHILGSVCNDKKGYSVPVAWLDDKAIDFSNISFIKGSYPVKENEIALEQTVLARLGIDNADVGDEIKLSFKVQNGEELFDAEEKTYILSGIVSDKFSNITRYSPSNTLFVPGGFVSQNTVVDTGGKEKISVYALVPKNNNAFLNLWKNFEEVREQGLFDNFTEDYNNSPRLTNVLWNGNNLYIAILVAALIVASGVTIINAFNTNLSDRKKQIGMLRAVGTTKKQIFTIFGREALFISLICVPVSIALSYFAVWLIFKISGTELVMTKSIWVLPVSAVLGMAVVMLSALVPIANASRITPMQAIRDIEKSRKMKRKKIKTQKSFNTSTLLAKRSLSFSGASRISVSIILIATIAFSCLGFSYISYEKANPYDYYFDYSIVDHFSFWNNYSNDKYSTSGFDETEFQDISAIPYISDIYGEKGIGVNLQIDEYADFFKCFSGAAFESKIYNEWDNDYTRLDYDNYYEAFFNDYSDYYLELKKVLGEEKETITMDLDSYCEPVLEQLNDVDIQGEINFDKISSGEEVIMLAPQKAEYSVELGKRGSINNRTLVDGEKPEKNYQIIFDAECPYKVGDTLNLTVAVNESTDDEGKPVDVELTHKQVKIGAIVSPQATRKVDYIRQGRGFCLLTSNQGMNSFMDGVKYGSIYLLTDTELDDSKEKIIQEGLEPFKIQHDAYVMSNYEEQQRQKDSNAAIYYSLLALITICFVICASIINNTLSARIRESKKQIGTIRAFGANQTELVKSYFRQMMSMLLVGIMLGFAVYTVGFFAVVINNKLKGRSVDLIFDPWLTLVFCIVLIAVCTLNLWIKVRKEMKNSIIENIREL